MDSKKERRESVKQQLRKYTGLVMETKTIAEEIEKLEAQLEYKKPGAGQGSGARTDRTAEIVSKIVDLTNDQEGLLLQRLRERERIESAVNALVDPQERALLRMRYILGMSWSEIYENLECEWRTMLYIHANALDHIAEYFYMTCTKLHYVT